MNNRLNVNKGNVSWKDRSVKRRENARADLGGRKGSGNKLGGADKRQDFRGRDAQRDNARASLKSKGIDPAAERKNLRGAGGGRVRDNVGRINKGGTARSGSGLRDKASGGNTGAAKRNLSNMSSRNRDHALNGLNDGNRAKRNVERGNFSNRSSSNRGAGSFSGRAGGGSGHRGGGGNLRRR